MLIRLILGFVLAVAVATAATTVRALTPSGAVAASVVGTIIVGFGGWDKAALLVLFFGSSSLLTRWQAARKSHPEHRAGRSADQVFANGAVATILAVWSFISPAPWVVAAFAGAIATSTADTWATEIGLLSKTPPRLITTWRVCEPGRSGGVTLLGTAGGIAGAAVIAAAAHLLLSIPLAAMGIAGVAAMLVDSVLGATLEGRWRWFDNNVVNLAATIVGAGLAMILSR